MKNFGDWEVVPFTKLPNLDTKYSIKITNLKPSNGESYLAICERVRVAILNISKNFLMVQRL